MRRLSSAQSLACVLLLLVGACAALADTIVLKNGRRIIASNVVEEDGHVSYKTPADHLSLPKSIVDHIERGGVLPSRSGMSVPPLDIAPPTNGAVDASEEISRGAVHEGRIDREYISKLELAARSGAAGASDRAKAHARSL